MITHILEDISEILSPSSVLFLSAVLFSYSITFIFFNIGTEDRNKKKYRPVLPFYSFRSTIKENKCNRIRKHITTDKRTEEGHRHLRNVF